LILKLLQNKEKTNIKNWRGEKRRKFTRKEVSSGENEREIVVFAVGVSVIEICGSQQPAKIPLLKGGRERDRFINNIASRKGALFSLLTWQISPFGPLGATKKAVFCAACESEALPLRLWTLSGPLDSF